MNGCFLNVRDVGAVGDGLAADTQAIQRAIDACGAAGGGKVVVPPGTYRVGMLVMRDHVNLHLEAGARLQAATDRADYQFPVQYEGKFTGVSYPGLIYGKGVSDVSITGQGVLDGQDEAFWKPREKIGSGLAWYLSTSAWGWFSAGPWRPHMVLFDGCRDVRVEGIAFERSPVYAVWMIDCQRVGIRGIRVRSHFHGPNTDGIHLSSCRFVRISDCDFYTGDDAISIDGDGNGPTEHVAITNCTFETLKNVLRLYTGIDPWHKTAAPDLREAVRHVVLSNCTVHEAAGAVNIMARRGVVEQVSISNLTLRMTLPGVAICLMTDEGTVRNISISQVSGQANGACSVCGRAGDLIEGVRLSQCHFDIQAVPKEFGLGYPDPVPNSIAYRSGPYGIYLRHAASVALHDISLRWLNDLEGQSWSAVRASDLDRLEINGLSADQVGGGQTPVIHLSKVRRAVVDRCEGTARRYLETEEMEAGALVVGGMNAFGRD